MGAAQTQHLIAQGTDLVRQIEVDDRLMDRLGDVTEELAHSQAKLVRIHDRDLQVALADRIGAQLARNEASSRELAQQLWVWERTGNVRAGQRCTERELALCEALLRAQHNDDAPTLRRLVRSLEGAASAAVEVAVASRCLIDEIERAADATLEDRMDDPSDPAWDQTPLQQGSRDGLWDDERPDAWSEDDDFLAH